MALLQTLERRRTDVAEGKTGKMVSAVSAKRATILSLDLSAYDKWAPVVEKGFLLAAQFMRKQHFFSARELPYRTQLVPLATVLSQIGDSW